MKSEMERKEGRIEILKKGKSAKTRTKIKERKSKDWDRSKEKAEAREVFLSCFFIRYVAKLPYGDRSVLPSCCFQTLTNECPGMREWLFTSHSAQKAGQHG